MKLLLGNTRRPDISFYTNGRIDITARAAKLIGLHAGDVIDIAVEGFEYYLYVKHTDDKLVGRHEAQCHRTSHYTRVCNNLRCHSKRLAALVLNLCGNPPSARLPLGEATELPQLGTAAPIIIRNNLSKV